MRTLVCGGRNFTDWPVLFAELDALDAEFGPTFADRAWLSLGEDEICRQIDALPEPGVPT